MNVAIHFKYRVWYPRKKLARNINILHIWRDLRSQLLAYALEYGVVMGRSLGLAVLDSGHFLIPPYLQKLSNSVLES